MFGTDFSMMENVFKRRSRQDLKMKFKKEERTNRPLVDKCLSQGLKFDASFFDEESEQEENEEELIRLEKEDKAKKKEDKKKAKAEERKAAAAAKKPKKRVRKVKSNRGYFDNSSEGERLKEYIFSYFAANSCRLDPVFFLLLYCYGKISHSFAIQSSYCCETQGGFLGKNETM